MAQIREDIFLEGLWATAGTQSLRDGQRRVVYHPVESPRMLDLGHSRKWIVIITQHSSTSIIFFQIR
jgi:hypothetical protein